MTAPVSNEATPKISKPSRLRRWLRFSLRSLILLMLLGGSAVALWQKWEPWRFDHALPRHERGVSDVSYSPDGKFVMTTEDGEKSFFRKITQASPANLDIPPTTSETVPQSIHLWSLKDNTRLHVFTGLFYSFEDFGGEASISRTGRFVQLSQQQDIMHWESTWDSKAGAHLDLPDADVTCRQLRFSNDDGVVAYTDREGNFRLFDLLNSRSLPAPKLSGHCDDVQFCPDGSGLVTLTDGVLTRWNNANEPAWSVNLKSEFIFRIEFSPDQSSIAYTGYISDKQQTGVVDAKDGSRRFLAQGWFQRDSSDNAFPSIQSPVFSPTSDAILTEGDHNDWLVWSVGDGTLRATINDPDNRNQRFSADGRRIISISDKEKIFAWDAMSGQPVPPEPEDEDRFYPNRVSSDGQRRVKFDHGDIVIQIRNRPSQWWGAACLPEFWLTALFAVLFAWSLLRDHARKIPA